MRKNELNISEKTYSAFVLLAGYQIIGAFIGLGFITWLICKTEKVNTTTILLLCVMTVFYLYSLFCGIKCIQAKKSALRYSLVNQCLQLIGFEMSGFAFSYVAGLYLSFDVDATDGTDFSFGLGISKFIIRFNTQNKNSTFYINIIAIGIIIWIISLMRKVKHEMDFEKAEEIGIDITPQSIEN